MIPPVANDKMLFPQMMGDVVPHLNVSWSECWWFCGSGTLVLDLIWYTCTKGPLDPSASLSITKSNLISLISLLAAVVRSSPNHRESFIQGHGFHLLSMDLEELADRVRSLEISDETDILPVDAIFNNSLVDKCFDVLTSLGMDGHQGDGMIAALQGLLLNFKLWVIASEDTLDYLFTRTAAVVFADSGMELFKNIGIQRVIDLLRVYIAPNVPELCLPATFKPSYQRVVSSGLRLLHLTLEASFNTLHPADDADMFGIDLLLSTLDDSLHMLLVEGILQMLNEMRFNLPAQLQRALKLANFLEVGCVILLCRTDLSLVARRLITLLILWHFNETTKNVPFELNKLRYKCLLLYNAALIPPSAANTRKAKYRLNMDGSIERFKPLLEIIGRNWYLAKMLSECVQWSMEEYISRDSAQSITKVSDEILEILNEDGTLGRLPVWLVLPFLAALLPTSSPLLAQQILMSASVHLKTDEGVQCEVFCSLEDWSWVDLLVDIALFGCSEANPEKAEIVGSFYEISLEILGTVIEHKIRNHDDESWIIWRVLMEKTKEICTPPVHQKIMKRCGIILFQRLCRNSSKWPFTLIANVGKIFFLMENEQMMGNSIVNDEVLERSRSEENVLGLEYVRSAPDESMEFQSDQIQMIGLMIDIMGKVRFAAKEQDLSGYELLALQPALRILLGCVITNSNELSDYICHELHTFLKYMTGNVAVCSTENFNRFILVVFGMLKSAIHHPNVPETIRGKYTALVYSYLHHFYDLKYTFIHSGKHVPEHVVMIMNAVTSIDSHNIDVETVFALFKISLQKEDVITFSDGMATEDSFTKNPEASSKVSPKSSPRKSIPVEFLTPKPEEPSLDNEGRRFSFSAEAMNDAFMAAKAIGTAHSRDYAFSIDESDENISDGSSGFVPNFIKSSEQSSFFVKDPFRLRKFLNWKRKRLSAAEKFITVERERLRKFKSSVMFRAKVIRRFWTKMKRKVESEVLLQMNFESSWKLGTDECVFPGRERVVLRRKYNTADDHGHRVDTGANLSMEKMNEVLINYINKPALEENAREDEKVEPEDYDEDEEDNSKDNAKVEVVDDDLSEQNRVITGPCHTGARRANFGAIKDEAEVTLVTPSGNYAGSIAFSRKDVSFISRNSVLSEEDYGAIAADANKKFTRRRWTLSAVSQIFLRRYRLRDTALEVFFRRGKHRNFFVDFGHSEDSRRRRDEFARNLMKASPKSAFKQWPSMSPFRIVSELGVLSQWQRGEISNFEYLMALNTAAGRSYNDLCQVRLTFVQALLE